METVGDGIIKECRNAKESLRDEIDPLNKTFEPQVVPQIDCRKVRKARISATVFGILI